MDLIQLASEPPPPGSSRLPQAGGARGEVLAGSTPPLSEIWELAQQNLAALPEPWKALRPAQRYPVRFSDELQALRREAAEAAGGRLPASPAGGPGI